MKECDTGLRDVDTIKAIVLLRVNFKLLVLKIVAILRVIVYQRTFFMPFLRCAETLYKMSWCDIRIHWNLPKHSILLTMSYCSDDVQITVLSWVLNLKTIFPLKVSQEIAPRSYVPMAFVTNTFQNLWNFCVFLLLNLTSGDLAEKYAKWLARAEVHYFLGVYGAMSTHW